MKTTYKGLIIGLTLIVAFSTYYFLHQRNQDMALRKVSSYVRKLQGSSLYFVTMQDGKTIAHNIQDNKGLVVSYLVNGDLEIKRPKTTTLLFSQDMVTETESATVYDIINSALLFAGAHNGDSTVGLQTEIGKGGDDVYRLHVRGAEAVYEVLAGVSEEYARSNVDMLRGAADKDVVLDILITTDYKNSCYLELNYIVGGISTNLVQVNSYTKLSNWKLGFEWDEISLSETDDAKLTDCIEQTTNTVSEILKTSLSDV